MTAGQAPEGQLVKLIFGRLKTPIKYEPFLEAKEMGGAKSLIIIMGGSGKGLGSAGVNIQDEMKRAEAILAEAAKQKLKIVGIHSGGEDRRGEVSNKMIALVAPGPLHDRREDGNKDGLFTKLAEQHKILLTLIQGTQDPSVLQGQSAVVDAENGEDEESLLPPLKRGGGGIWWRGDAA
jgi:hypothetical protein